MTGLPGTSAPLAAVYDVALLDLDGVVYVGPHAVPYAAQSLDTAREQHGMRAAFVTNNAARPPSVVAGHLRELGVRAEAPDVVTSAQAGARVLVERIPEGSRVLAVGGPGVGWALEERGMVPVTSADDAPVALMTGYGPEVGWRQLAEATLAIEAGALWVATNLDRTIPTPRGRVLGNGALVAALQHATGVHPLVAGKPEPPLMLESVQRTHAQRPLVVGDRLDTDIEGAVRAGIPSLLVLTGVSGWRDLLDAPVGLRPDFVGHDLRTLLASATPTTVEVGLGVLTARCGASQVTLRIDKQVREAPAHAMAAQTHTTGVPALGTAVPGAWAQGRWDWVPEEQALAGDVDLEVVRCIVGLAWTLADVGLEAAGQAEVR